MANTNVRWAGVPGLTGVKLFIFPENSDTPVDASGYTMTEESNRSGLYYAVVSDSASGTHFALVEDSAGAVLGNGWLLLQDDTNTYTVSQEHSLADQDINVSGSSHYYSQVCRGYGDDEPIYFEWTSNSATFTMEYSVDGGAFSASADAPSFSRSTGDSHIYEIPYNASERPESGLIEYKVTDGVITRVVPVIVLPSATQETVESILDDTNELQQNQGDWATATGFSTHSAGDVTANIVSSSSYALLLSTNVTGAIDSSDLDSNVEQVLTDLAVVDGIVDNILTDTDELQTNQGDWATATGFSTHSASAIWQVDAAQLWGANTFGLRFNTTYSAVGNLDDTIEDNSGTYRFTAAALAQAPSSSGGDATVANQQSILSKLETSQVLVNNKPKKPTYIRIKKNADYSATAHPRPTWTVDHTVTDLTGFTTTKTFLVTDLDGVTVATISGTDIEILNPGAEGQSVAVGWDNSVFSSLALGRQYRYDLTLENGTEKYNVDRGDLEIE